MLTSNERLHVADSWCTGDSFFCLYKCVAGVAGVSECTQSMDDALIVLYCTSVQLQLLLANQ